MKDFLQEIENYKQQKSLWAQNIQSSRTKNVPKPKKVSEDGPVLDVPEASSSKWGIMFFLSFFLKKGVWFSQN